MIPDPIVAALRARRLELGISQAELGRRLYVIQQRMAALESGTTSPTLYTARRWAQALGWDLYLAPLLDPRGQRRGAPIRALCGTISAAKRHYTRGEHLDDACRAAQRLYDRERKRHQRNVHRMGTQPVEAVGISPARGEGKQPPAAVAA